MTPPRPALAVKTITPMLRDAMRPVAAAVARVESSGRPDALRFEPLVYDRVRNAAAVPNVLASIKSRNFCSQATAAMIYSTSWGLYQIMGFNLYGGAVPIICPINVYLNMSDIQYDQFLHFLIDRGITYTKEELLSDHDALLTFAKKYNGSVEYASRLEASLMK